MKKSLSLFTLFLCAGILSIALVQAAKIDVISLKDSFQAGEKISLKVSLFDDSNNLLNDNVEIILEDADKKERIERVVQSNTFSEIDLGEEAVFGFWNVNAVYKDSRASAIFVVEKSEDTFFELRDNKLIITNVGNTRYAKTIQIIIGDSVGEKEPTLEIGESVVYRLIAPDGDYSIKVTDGKNTLSKGNVKLTGNAIGVLNDGIPKGVFLASGVANPGDEEYESSSISYEYLIKNKFIYVFIIVVIAASVLLLVGRNYRMKVKGKVVRKKKSVKKKK